jgi:hypothetical protein
MKKVENTCEVYLYKGKTHGFFNYNNTLSQTDSFLQSLGYVKESPKIEQL